MNLTKHIQFFFFAINLFVIVKKKTKKERLYLSQIERCERKKKSKKLFIDYTKLKFKNKYYKY